jgi:DNA-binding MarR family transcriptional regulator
MAGEVRWLDEEEARAWRSFVDVSTALTAELEHDLLTRHGLALGDYAVLVHLSEAPERRLRMCDLAAQLHLSPSGLTRRLNGLVRDGLVVREPCSSDRRVTYAVLTEEGFRRLADAAPDHVAEVRRRFIDRLDRRQLHELAGALDAVRTPAAAAPRGTAGSAP